MQFVVADPVKELLRQDKAEIVGTAAPPSLIEVDFETDPRDAVSVTVCEDTTDATFAAKFTLVASEGTVTETGTLTKLLLLARLMESPVLGAGALIVTAQVSVPAPVIDVFAQLNPESDEFCVDPLPCSLIQLAVVLLELAIAEMLSSPVKSVVEPGSKRTCAVMLAPAGKVTGNLFDCTVNALLEVLN